MSATEFRSPYAATASGRAERPNPRRSGAMTRNPWPTRCGTWWRQSRAESGQPWISSTGTPSPWSSTYSEIPLAAKTLPSPDTVMPPIMTCPPSHRDGG